VLTLELHLPLSQSLKDRRSIMNSLKERLRNRFNVSVAEAESGELWQRAGLVVSCAGAEPAIVEQVLNDVANFVDADERVQLLMPTIRFYA
jgi:uncharacterized protein